MAQKVLYVLANADLGGAEKATLMMMRHHHKEKYKPMALFFGDGPIVEICRQSQIDVQILGQKPRLRSIPSVFRAVKEIADIIKKQKISLVHSCMGYAHIFGGLAATMAHCPAVYYQHGPVGGWLDLVSSYIHAEKILVNSAYTRECQRKVRNGAKTPIEIVPLATEITLQESEKAGLRSDLNQKYTIGEDDIVVGMIGRFDPGKGTHLGLAAIAPLLKGNPKVRVVIVGGSFGQFHPGYGAELKGLADEMGITDRVIFAGSQKDILPYLARFDIYMQTSIRPEGFSLTLIEAMAAKVSVIGPRAWGPLEIISEDEDGLFHQPGNKEELTLKLKRLIEDPALRGKLAQNGQNKVLKLFTPEVMIERLEKSYESLVPKVRL